jgi:cupin 2 domain-containing protein
VTNLFADLPSALPEELVDVLLRRDGIRLERIVSLGHATPPGEWYDQGSNEWVMIVRGSAQLRFDDEAEVRTLAAGDYLDIPAHRRHRVEWTDPSQPTVWLALYY